jgi:signal transduction histidine kinase
MNLLINASQAINNQGEITITTGHVGNEAWVSICDTGQGISSAHLSRLFDPFFTTKPIGKGTGLGLSISQSIIQKHAGRIEVESELGNGTCFRIYLPMTLDSNGSLPE